MQDVDGPTGTAPAGRPGGRATRSSWATSWKLWGILLVLGLLLIAAVVLLPAYRRVRSFQYFDQHQVVYELTDRNTWLTDLLGDHAKGFREISRIGMDGSVSDETLLHVSEFEEITELFWRNSPNTSAISERGIVALRQLRNLTAVSLQDVILRDDQLAEWLAAGPPLSIVRMHRIELGADTLTALSRIPTLKYLDLSLCSLHDEDFHDLGPCVELTLLDLTGTGVGDEAAAWVARSRNLTDLRLGGNWITDAGLSEVATLPLLRSLTVSMCPDITDKGVENLAGLSSLYQLGLPSKSISQSSIDALRTLPLLIDVHVTGNIMNYELRQQMIDQWEYSDHLTDNEVR